MYQQTHVYVGGVLRGVDRYSYRSGTVGDMSDVRSLMLKRSSPTSAGRMSPRQETADMHGIHKKAFATAVFLSIVLAACGGNGGESGSTTTETAESPETTQATTDTTEATTDTTQGETADEAVPEEVLASVEAAKALPTFDAPGSPIDPTSLEGLHFFDIPLVPNPFVQSITDTQEAIAIELGHEYTVCANQGQVSQHIQCMDQALNQNVDMIILNAAPDPRALQPQLQAAEEAGIPVIITHFHDNSSPPPGEEGCVGCEDAGIDAIQTAPFYDAGRAAADWIIADSNGQANVLIVGGSEDIIPSPGTIETMQQRFEEMCPNCQNTVINIPPADWNTETQGEVQSALQANPDTDYVYLLYDAMVQGAVPAVETLGLTGEVKVGSYNGSPFALDFIRDGDIVAFDVGEDTPGIGYSVMDQAFRVLLGEEPVQTRTPIRIFDDSNVEDAGVPASPGVGYGDAFPQGYRELWGLD